MLVIRALFGPYLAQMNALCIYKVIRAMRNRMEHSPWTHRSTTERLVQLTVHVCVNISLLAHFPSCTERKREWLQMLCRWWSVCHTCQPGSGSGLWTKTLRYSCPPVLPVLCQSPAHVSRRGALAAASLVHSLDHHPTSAAHFALWGEDRGEIMRCWHTAAPGAAAGEQSRKQTCQSCSKACRTWKFT